MNGQHDPHNHQPLFNIGAINTCTTSYKLYYRVLTRNKLEIQVCFWLLYFLNFARRVCVDLAPLSPSRSQGTQCSCHLKGLTKGTSIPNMNTAACTDWRLQKRLKFVNIQTDLTKSCQGNRGQGHKAVNADVIWQCFNQWKDTPNMNNYLV